MATFRIDTTSPFQQVIEASPTGIVVVDGEGTVALVNQECGRLFGYVGDELVGRCIKTLVPDGLCASPRLAGRRKDGSRIPIEVGLNPVDTPQGRFIFASIVNLTERDRLEETRRLALEEQLAFERLMAELSAQFINLARDQLDGAIREGLRRVSEILELDRSTFFRIDENGTVFGAVSWEAAGLHPIAMPIAATDQFPWALQRSLAGETLLFSTLSEIPSEIDRAGYRALGIKSSVVVPVAVDGRVVGGVSFNAVRVERTWPPDVVRRLEVFACVFGHVLARRHSEESLRKALSDVEGLKNQLQVENVQLRREVREWRGPANVVGQSAAIHRVLEQIQQVAATDSTVLLLGETGTGKELFAAQIHELGPRRGRPMVRVNCAAIPATLIESELFGREKGAYTGALARQVGRFELADRSTIFLDEIGDLPVEVQVKLLRVLEERQIERLGSPRPIGVDARIIAATHRDLDWRMAEGTFREDLYYRLNVFPIRVPPLRDRPEDIPLLVWRFVDEFSKLFGRRIDGISKESLAALQQYSWPGNVRELRNIVERAMISGSGPRLAIPSPHAPPASSTRRSGKLVDVEREHIRAVLHRTGWRIRGAGGAAESLGLKPTTLETRMVKLGLKRPGATRGSSGIPGRL